MTDEDVATVRAFIAKAPWVFAKTIPESPHEYTVRGQTPHDEFEHVVQLIRDHGYERRYGRATYTYLDVDGWRFWTMGAPIPQTTILNRAINEAAR
jgi:hypothetical protein